MSDDTRERARQVAHRVIADAGGLVQCSATTDTSLCAEITDALVAFANAAADAENEACQRIVIDEGYANCYTSSAEAADAIVNRLKGRK